MCRPQSPLRPSPIVLGLVSRSKVGSNFTFAKGGKRTFYKWYRVGLHFLFPLPSHIIYITDITRPDLHRRSILWTLLVSSTEGPRNLRTLLVSGTEGARNSSEFTRMSFSDWLRPFLPQMDLSKTLDLGN